MKTDIIKLENILNQEIEAYSNLEKYMSDKKDSLIKGDIEELKNVDCEIEKFALLAEKLEAKRNELISKSGESYTLKEIINNAEDKNQASRLSNARSKLLDVVSNVHKLNDINAQLIYHSLKLIEHSVISIANVLVPESSAYNYSGKIKNSSSTSVSSIVEEA